MGFQSPAWDLLQLMATRRKEQQDQLLNEAQVRNYDSIIKSREVENASMDEQRQAIAEYRKAQAQNLARKDLRYHQELDPDTIKKAGLGVGDIEEQSPYGNEEVVAQGDAPSPMFPNELNRKAGEHYLLGPQGRIDPMPPESLQPSPKKVYAGDQEDQERVRKQKLFDIFRNMPKEQLDKMDPFTKEMIYRQIFGASPSAAALAPPMEPQPVYHPDTDSFSTPPGAPPRPKGSAPINAGRPPQPPREPQGPAPQFFTGFDENGNPKSGWVKPGDPIPDWVNRKGNQPVQPGGANKPRQPRITDTEKKVYSAAKSKMDASKSFWSGKPSPETSQIFDVAKKGILNRFPSDVVDRALQIFKAMEAGVETRSVYSIVSDPSVPNDAREDLAELLTFLRENK